MSIVSNLPETTWASIYINSVSVIMLLGVMVLYNRARRHDKTEKKFFSWMSIQIIVLSFSYMFQQMARDQLLGQNGHLIQAEAVFHDVVFNAFCLIWILYANYRMYHSLGYVERKSWLYLAPFVTIIILNIVNLFLPVFRYYGEDGLMHNTMLNILQDVVRYSYMTVSLVQLYRHNKEGKTDRFFSLLPFVAPGLVGAVVHNVTPEYIQTTGLAMAMGLTLLYAEIANEQSFCDRETGLYNRSYVDYMAELIEEEVFHAESIMIFDIADAENIKDFAKIIRKQVPAECEIIRYKKNQVMMISSVTEKAPLFMVSEDVKLAVEEYNENHSENPMEVQIRYQLKKQKESCYDLFDRVLKQLNLAEK